MKYETVPISTLREDPANVRRHPARNLAAIEASLKRWGQQKPIVVDEQGLVIAGNGTLAAARNLRWETIEVVRTGLTGTERTAYSIADNRTGELAEWDVGGLGDLLAELDKADMGLEALGWDPPELKALLGGADFGSVFSAINAAAQGADTDAPAEYGTISLVFPRAQADRVRSWIHKHGDAELKGAVLHTVREGPNA